ncbi:MAG: small GTP-binding protein [marine actinobacterium MedAcidi-G2B]|nr:MAG: small GTP-binding protein [marine actinobacterium MedAcidi-G2B]MDC0246007.1 ribosome biogenesis GTPase Der [Acidimicrobiaceae bacterium]|tara:strand:- start:6701 stop:7996 length:1296 start_codon:yes stop_codon:yes gene_type:complete
MNPVVAIVGRPNVGKSTLMNRIIGRREAIVEERPGVTRDRKEVEAFWLDRTFTLIDTGGWITGGDSLDAKVSRQSEQAMFNADVVLFVLDSTVGITEEDAQVADLLRKEVESVIVVANKVDDRNHESSAWELMSLGLGEPSTISALHGRGTGDLLDRVIELLPEPVEIIEEEVSEKIVSVSLVGRPNVGKSTLFNRLIGEERAVVHDRPGTTRDAVDTMVETRYGPVRFIDTAGMRRKARIDENTEYYSLVRALKAVDAADVALLIIDSVIGVTHQDQRLAERVDAAGCPIVVLLNKWDLCDGEQREDVSAQVGEKLHFVGNAPVIKISALTGKNVDRLWPALSETIEDYRTRIPTRRVNDAVRAAQQAHPAPGGARVLYATQGATDPPTFTLFTNRELPRTWIRFLERRLREDLDLGSTPIKLRVRRRSE